MTNQNTRKNKKCSGFNAAWTEISPSKKFAKAFDGDDFRSGKAKPAGNTVVYFQGL